VYLSPVENSDTDIRFPVKLQAGSIVTVRIAAGGNTQVVETDRRLPLRQKGELDRIIRHMLSLDFPLDEFQAMCRQKKATAVTSQSRRGLCRPTLRVGGPNRSSPPRGLRGAPVRRTGLQYLHVADPLPATLLRLAKKGWGRMSVLKRSGRIPSKRSATTNASWGYTEKMCRNLCDQLGETAPSGLKTFPAPEEVIRYGERRLKEKVGMGYRSKSLMLLAKRAISGEVSWLLDFTMIPDAHTAEEEISSWYGFGRYATRHLLVLMGFHEYLPIDREVGSHLGIRKPGDTDSNLDSDHFEDWGKFRFTAYKLTRVANRLNWIGD